MVFKKILYKIIRKLEKFPLVILFFLNNISKFKFFLPHEKDYLGLKIIFKNKKKINTFLDIGANTGTSTLGFIKMGFKNTILLFEPNHFIFQKYLTKIKNNNSNVKIFNLALGSKTGKLIFFFPIIENKIIHYFSSFDKKYIINSCLETLGKKNLYFEKKKIEVRKYDDLKIKEIIDFIKIDTEGYDYEVLKGLKQTIKKFRPTILVENNPHLFDRIHKFLNNYTPYVFNVKNNSLLKLNNVKSENLDRFGKLNLLSIRNIFFIHKENNIKYLR